MIIHSMVVQIRSSGVRPGWEHVACLRDDVALLDRNHLELAFSMLMLLLPGVRDAFAKPLLHNVDVLLPDIDISRRLACTWGIASDHKFRDGRLQVDIVALQR